MRLIWVPALAVLMGCPPPPADGGGGDAGGDPKITIVYPPQLSEIALAADGVFRTVVVVDIDNYDVGSQADTGAAPDGHWHLQLLQQPFTVVFDNYGEVVDDSGMLQPGDVASIRAFLVNNNHQPIGPESVLEFTVTASPDSTSQPATGS